MFDPTRANVKFAIGAALLALTFAAPTMAQRSNQKKPNILVVWAFGA